MIEALWSVLPGPWWVRLLIFIVALAVIVWAIWTFIYPLLGEWLLPAEDAPLLE